MKIIRFCLGLAYANLPQSLRKLRSWRKRLTILVSQRETFNRDLPTDTMSQWLGDILFLVKYVQLVMLHTFFWNSWSLGSKHLHEELSMLQVLRYCFFMRGYLCYEHGLKALLQNTVACRDETSIIMVVLLPDGIIIAMQQAVFLQEVWRLKKTERPLEDHSGGKRMPDRWEILFCQHICTYTLGRG